MHIPKSWREKLADNKGLPRVEKVRSGMISRWGRGTVVIPAPIEVDGIMKLVPFGKVITINEIRVALAKKYHATIGCPITTGIFAWIAANAAAEDAAQGKEKVTPYWRTLKANGQVNEKYPGGISAICKLLRGEGHKIVKRGSKFHVGDYQNVLFTL